MGLSIDVNLPRAHPARYPQRCVRCGCDNQGRTMRIWTHTIGWWTVLFWSLGWGFTTNPPVCTDCSWRIRAQRTGGLLLTLVAAILVLVFVWPYRDSLVARSLRKWAVMMLILLCISPYLMWEILYPPAIDITAFKDSVDYEFSDQQFAHEFAELNADAEWIKIS